MVQEYIITGMTCGGCEAKVKSKLLSVPFVKDVEVSKETNFGKITMEKKISITDLQNSLGGTESKYKISESFNIDTKKSSKSWIHTYKPILIIFTYITLISTIIQFKNDDLNIMEWMQHFMAGFFLIFSFFKILNLNGFAKSYVMYDVLAKKIPAWSYVYAFLELALGLAYLINFNPFVTNLTTLVVMSISIVGVLQTVLNKRKIQCACLGSIFNLPMSTVTIIEDGLMILMSGAMLYYI